MHLCLSGGSAIARRRRPAERGSEAGQPTARRSAVRAVGAAPAWPGPGPGGYGARGPSPAYKTDEKGVVLAIVKKIEVLSKLSFERTSKWGRSFNCLCYNHLQLLKVLALLKSEVFESASRVCVPAECGVYSRRIENVGLRGGKAAEVRHGYPNDHGE
jgi:hypothetical protein